MSGCCDGCAPVDPERTGQLRRVLWVVLALNVGLFTAEMLIGWWADSSSLQADALDSLSDAFVYAVTLGAVTAGLRAQAGAALLKGGIQAAFGIGVLIAAIWRFWSGAEPFAPWMATTAFGALVVNLACFALLTRYRNDGVNMRSVWLCSRNDAISNVGVIVAGGLVSWTGKSWPDLTVALLIAGLFLHTSFDVLKAAMAQWRSNAADTRSVNVRTG